MTHRFPNKSKASRLPILPLLALLGSLTTAMGRAADQNAASAAPPLLPVEDFARAPDLNAMNLSPDGKFLGYIFQREKHSEMAVQNLETERSRSFSISHYGTLDIGAMEWLTPDRVLLWTGYGLAAVDRDFSRLVGLTGWARSELNDKRKVDWIGTSSVIGHAGNDPLRVLLNDSERQGWGRQTEWFPNIIEISTSSGMYRMHTRNPGRVAQWLQDWDGRVLFGVVKGKTEEDPYRLIQRSAEDQPWQEPILLGPTTRHFWLSGLSAKGDILYITRRAENGCWELTFYDLATRRVSEQPLFNAGEYDLTPPEDMPTYAGEPLAREIYAQGYRRLLGVRYVTDGPHTYWFASDFESLQKQLDALHPDMLNLVVSLDREVKKALVLSYSAREPGIYSLVDLLTGRVSIIGRRCPWIKPEQMADTYPIACSARDGLPLHGYLTLPSGRARKNLPMVTLVHGGPWVRDVWGYDPVVQFLANRGYAVLQVNYRGSSGYGAAFLAQGKKEIGGRIQDDIVDMTQWVVRQGIADARRLAIAGASYGGYSAMFALAKMPEVFRCGISYAGVSDWPALWEFREDEAYKAAYYYWGDRIGDMSDPAVRTHLEHVSPLQMAAEIKAPLLLIHGEADRSVPPSQTRRMMERLTAAGHPPKVVLLPETGHWIPVGKQGRRYLEAIEQFLAEHLGPG